jgi:hypothetical protein
MKKSTSRGSGGVSTAEQWLRNGAPINNTLPHEQRYTRKGRRAEMPRTCTKMGLNIGAHIHMFTQLYIHIYIILVRGWGSAPQLFSVVATLLCFFFIYLWVSRCNQVGFKPILHGPRLECIASLPRLCRTGTCGPVPGGRLDKSRSWRRETVTRVSPMLTGAPNKVRGIILTAHSRIG